MLSLSSAFVITSLTDSADSAVFSLFPTSVVTLTVPLSSVTVSAAVSPPVFTSRLSMLPSVSEATSYSPSSAADVITGEAAVTAAISPARILFRMEDTYFLFPLSEGLYTFLFLIIFSPFFAFLELTVFLSHTCSQIFLRSFFHIFFSFFLFFDRLFIFFVSVFVYTFFQNHPVYLICKIKLFFCVIFIFLQSKGLAFLLPGLFHLFFLFSFCHYRECSCH